MSDIRDKLDALTKRQGLMTGAQWLAQRREEETARAEGRFEVGRVLPGEVVGSEAEGGFFLLRQDFPLDALQGHVTLGTVLETRSEHIAFSACDPALGDFDPRRTLFMDTETTGLAGGTGTVAFLVGVGYFADAATFRLDQCFLRDYDDEEPMLAFLAGLFTDRETVVGYNSKCFDLPLLRTRFIQNRIPFRLDGFAHYDLMHAARRLWKARLGSCTLNNVERHILGLRRHGDVPGHLIPGLWLEYLRTRDARPLEAVFYHHRMDILSLVALTGLISQVLEAPDGQGFTHAQDRLSVVRVHFRQKDYARVIAQGAHFIDVEDNAALRRECMTMMALAHRRTQQFAEMAAVLERLAGEFPDDVFARVELAKYHEHRSRDLPRAEAACREALALLARRGDPGHDAVEARLRRIQRKLGRGGGDPGGQLSL